MIALLENTNGGMKGGDLEDDALIISIGNKIVVLALILLLAYVYKD
jgi:hypothetical protein